MTFDPRKHNRRSIRLRGYDYGQEGAYLVTICTYGRECILGAVKNGSMLLTEWGQVVEASWRNLPCHFRGIELDAFVVMPNHIHGVVAITGRGEAFAPRFEEALRFSQANASPLLRFALRQFPLALATP